MIIITFVRKLIQLSVCDLCKYLKMTVPTEMQF